MQCLIDDISEAIFSWKVRLRLYESVLLRRHVGSNLRHLRRCFVGGLLAHVSQPQRLRVAAEPLNSWLSSRFRHRLSSGMVILDTSLFVSVSADERFLEHCSLDFHNDVAILHIVYTRHASTSTTTEWQSHPTVVRLHIKPIVVYTNPQR